MSFSIHLVLNNVQTEIISSLVLSLCCTQRTWFFLSSLFLGTRALNLEPGCLCFVAFPEVKVYGNLQHILHGGGSRTLLTEQIYCCLDSKNIFYIWEQSTT